MSPNHPAPRAGVVPLMVAMLAIPAALTLPTVLVPGTLEIRSEGPTPQGYTWSLLLFVVPLPVIAWWGSYLTGDSSVANGSFSPTEADPSDPAQ